jgi:subtilase family serine protease/thiamine pyrophosphokinase
MKKLVLLCCTLLTIVSTYAQTAPDLTITSSTSANTAIVGDILTATYTVTNNGTADAPMTSVSFYQSADAVLTPGANGDVLIFPAPVPALAAGASTGPVTRMLPIPCTQPPGSYTIFLVVDGNAAIAESNEDNNLTFNTLTVNPLTLTLTPSATSVCTGSAASLSVSGATSYAWSGDGLSANSGATVTATPAATTTYTVTGTRNGCSTTGEVVVTVNEPVTPTIDISYTGCAGGSPTFTATTTHGGSNSQINWAVDNIVVHTGSTFTLENASNGMQVVATLTSDAACATTTTATSATVTLNCVVTPTIDLTATGSVTPSTVVVGNNVETSFTVSNSGNTASAASKVAFYVSADASLTIGMNGDLPLGSYNLALVPAGGSVGPLTQSIVIPCTLPAGTYYIFTVVDSENGVAETNELNNTISATITVLPLAVSASASAATICSGTSTTLTASGAATYSWSPAEGLSATSGATVTASPTTTTTYTVTGTANGCTATNTVTVEVTPSVTPSVSISSSGCPSTTLTFTATPVNGGSAPVIEWYVDNSMVHTGASYTLNNATNGTQVFAKLTSNATCASPAAVTSSTITVDCIPVPPTIDLVATGSVTPTNVIVGNTAEASFTISNTGNTDAPASKVAFYVSADAALTPGLNGDLPLGSYNLATVPAGGSLGPVTRSIPIPCTFTPGNYYIFMVADGEGTIAETNEGNNTISTMVTVQPFDITVTAAANTVCAGSSTTLTASGGTTYTWSPAATLNATTGASVTATPANTTTYTVTGTANGCSSTKTVSVQVTPAVVPAITISNSGCPTNTIVFNSTVTNGGTAPVVDWYVNDTKVGTGSSYTMNNATNNTPVYAKLTSNAACASPQTVTSTTITVNCITTSIPNIDGVEEVTVLPNPTKGALAVRLKLNTAKVVSFRVSDAQGREVYRRGAQRINGTTTQVIDLHKEAAGIYYLQVQVGAQTFTEKIVRAD